MELVSLLFGAAIGALAVIVIEHLFKGFNFKDVKCFVDNNMDALDMLPALKSLRTDLKQEGSSEAAMTDFMLGAAEHCNILDMNMLYALMGSENTDPRYLDAGISVITSSEAIFLIHDIKRFLKLSRPHCNEFVKEIIDGSVDVLAAWAHKRKEVGDQIHQKHFERQ